MPEANDKEKSVHAVVSWTTELKRIIGTPVAADGGSLALEVERIDEGVEFLVLNRSIAARGTDAFETLSSQRGVLSHDEVLALINVLGQLPVFGENADVGMVENFLAILKRKYWATKRNRP